MTVTQVWQCDRCKEIFETDEGARLGQVTVFADKDSHHGPFDFCEACWRAFQEWVKG